MGKIKSILILSLLASSSFVFAQEAMLEKEGLAEETMQEYGGYGAPVVKMTRINKTDGVLNGVKGAWIIDKEFAIGGAFYGLVNNVNFNNYNKPLEFFYGGITFDYIYHATDDISFTAGVLLGGGISDFNDNVDNSDGVFTAEPEVSAQYAFSDNVKGALLVGYRQVLDSDKVGISDSRLSGITYGLSVNIGVF